MIARIGDTYRVLTQSIFSSKAFFSDESISFVGKCGELVYLYNHKPAYVLRFIVGEEEIDELFSVEEIKKLWQ